MSLDLDSANVVVLGHFNPYILSPAWLLERNIWDKQKVQLAVGPFSDGLRFQTVDGEIAWEVDSHKLFVSSLKSAGELVAAVLKELPHTPVSALGCNFSYSSAEWNSDLSPSLGSLKLSDLPGDLNAELVKWAVICHQDEVRMEVSLACGSEGTTLAFNFHLNVRNAEEAGSAAERFDEFKDRAQNVIRSLFGEDIR